MDELVKLVASKTGISEKKAEQAVETVLGFLKEKLPEPLASQIDGLVDGADLGGLDDLAKGLGGLLGKK